MSQLTLHHTESRTPHRPLPQCPRCGGNLVRNRMGDYVNTSCLACGRDLDAKYLPKPLGYEVRLPLQRAEIEALVRRSQARPKPTLDVPEPELTHLVEQYCDLRRRGFTQAAIRAKMDWPRHYPNLLLEEARTRQMPDTQGNQGRAFDEWVLTAHDAGVSLGVIQGRSAYPPQMTKRKLANALDAASGRNHDSLIVPGPDGLPGRVSWITPDGHLEHRAFDGPFPSGYPMSDAVEQCRQVLIQLTVTSNERERAHTMLLLAEAGLHSIDHQAGKQIYNVFANAGMDDDAKRTVILSLHENPGVGRLLLDRCGISPRWLNAQRTRSLSRRLREYRFTPALVRAAVEFAGHNPDTYYVIGPEYRIPKPEPAELEKCVGALRQAGADTQRIEAALSTLGVPPGGHWPPR